MCGTACGQADRQGDAAECVQQRRQVGIVARDGVRNVEEQGARLGVGQGIDAVTQCPAGAAHGFLAAERGEQSEAGDGGEDGEAGLDRRAGAFPRGFQVVEDQQGRCLGQALSRGGKALGWVQPEGEEKLGIECVAVGRGFQFCEPAALAEAGDDRWVVGGFLRQGGLADAARALDQHGGGIGRRSEGGDDTGGVVRAAETAVGEWDGCAFGRGGWSGVSPALQLSQRLDDFGLQVMGIDEVGSDSIGVLGAGPEGVQLRLCRGLSEHRGDRSGLDSIVHQIGTDLQAFRRGAFELQFGDGQILWVQIGVRDDLAVAVVADQQDVDVGFVDQLERIGQQPAIGDRQFRFHHQGPHPLTEDGVARRLTFRFQVAERAGYHDLEIAISHARRFSLDITNVEYGLALRPARRQLAKSALRD